MADWREDLSTVTISSVVFASAMAAFAAAIMAFEEQVASDTASTPSALCFSMIFFFTPERASEV